MKEGGWAVSESWLMMCEREEDDDGREKEKGDNFFIYKN